MAPMKFSSVLVAAIVTLLLEQVSSSERRLVRSRNLTEEKSDPPKNNGIQITLTNDSKDSKGWSPKTPISTEVIIIGAGAAGLSARYTLAHHGITNVKILEASDRFGGRVRQDTTFITNYPLSLGAAFVQYPDAIQSIIGRRNVMEQGRGMGSPVFAGYTWYDFFNDFIAPKDNDTIHYGCKVTRVVYRGQKSKVLCTDGRWFETNYVIATVPLSVLKDGDINFVPALPASMTTNHPGWMWQGFKVFIEFSRDLYNGSFCLSAATTSRGQCIDLNGENLFWDHSSVQSLTNGHTLLEGYILGDQSEPFITKSDDEIVNDVMQLINQEYFGRVQQYKVRHMVYNWSKDPNVRGALSSWGYDRPGTGNPSGAQNVLNWNRLFIAGEAFPVDGSNGWVDSAVFSGDDAAKQILKLSRGITDDTWFYTLVRNNLLANGGPS